MKNSRQKLLWWNRIINAVLLIVLLLTGYSIFFPEQDLQEKSLVEQIQYYAEKRFNPGALPQANTMDFTNLYPIAFGKANLLVLWPPAGDTIKKLARELEQLAPAAATAFQPEFAVRIGYIEEKGNRKIFTGFFYNRNGLVQSGGQLYRMSTAGQQLLNQELGRWVELTQVRNGFYLAAGRRDWSALDQLAEPAVIAAVRAGKIPTGEPIQIEESKLDIEYRGDGKLISVKVKDRIKLTNGRRFTSELILQPEEGRWRITGLN